MKRMAWFSALSVLSVLPVLLQAKGTTVLIDVRHADSPPQRITDARVRQFNIWEGPGVGGVTMNDGDGFIVAWKFGAVAEALSAGPEAMTELLNTARGNASRGASRVEKPSGLTRYEVVFSIGCADPAPTGRSDCAFPAYAVSYEFDPASGRGFVYVPGPRDMSYRMNSASIYRGPAAEGRWFLATDAWNTFARSQFNGLVAR